MYLLVRLKLIRKVLKYYAQNLPEEDRKTINACLGMIKFGMRSTLIQYHGKYYVYKGVTKGKTMEDEDISLTIGAYKSAFCASCIFKMTEISFLRAKHRGIHRDDALVIFTGG
eukprot:7326183-Ditylum_brightwellii.AAC.1